ncbi:solute carrier family 26 member 10-like isoform X2 [Dromiciops gliroides]|uniref:solute carrier family 26 member 10-like isoform X2 n=1 Tax=Dromiciops gliroides TaxID=33562 RepID=UPI001CC4671A|nr:solute carrier family 26 member 10-like isoform X2 [Dromiciops gliroides]
MSESSSTVSSPVLGEESDPVTSPGSEAVSGVLSPLTEALFQRHFGGAEQSLDPLPDQLLRGFRDKLVRICSRREAWRLLRARFPPLTWLPWYRWRTWLLGDAVAGVTVGVVHVPQGMAFALLTSVPPVFGLYTSFFPVLIYTFLGTGRHLSTGTFAVLSLMTGSAVESLVPEPPGGNLSATERMQLDLQRVGVAAAVAFWSGLGMFALQLGFLATFLSQPVVKALTSGAAVHVLVSQLQSLLGLPFPRQIGYFALFKTLAAVLTSLPQSSPAELTISALSLALLVPVKELNVRFRERLPTPIPGEVFMVLLASLLCFTSSLDTRYNVQIVGSLPVGFPQPLIPSLSTLPLVLAYSLPIALVTFAVSVSLASIYADKHSYTINPNQELLAHGVSNLVSSLFSCFPNSASLATTSLLVDAGGNTQLTGLFSCAVVLLVLLWLGPLFYYLPKAVLACINISSMRQMFFQMQELPQLWHISKMDFAVWLVTWVAVVTLSVDLGLAIGVIFSMMTVVCRTQRIQCLVLGQVKGRELFCPVRESSKLCQVPGLRIFRYPAPLYFGTRGRFRQTMGQLLGLEKQDEEPAKSHGSAETGAELVQVVILDCSGIIFVDVAGARELVQLASQCSAARIHLLLAQCNGKMHETGEDWKFFEFFVCVCVCGGVGNSKRDEVETRLGTLIIPSVGTAPVLGTLRRAGLLDILTPEQLFVSVQDAAAHALESLEPLTSKTCMVWV